MVRVALTQTRNAFLGMPETVDGLDALHDKLDAIREANLEHHGKLIDDAAAMGVKMLGLGELFTAPYFAHDGCCCEFWKGLAESSLDGPAVRFMQRKAAQHGMVIVAPIYERAEDGSFFDTAVCIDADGTRLGIYRKTHIPKGHNEQGGFDESFYYGPSDGNGGLQPGALGSNAYFPVFETTYGKVGVAICFDRHFEGVISTLADAGAEVIFSPAVTFGAKSRMMWELEFQVDATRNQVFIGGSNRLGAEQPWNVEYFGQSHFVGPHGRLDNISKQETLVVADLHLAELSSEDPAGWALRENRRSIFGLATNDS